MGVMVSKHDSPGGYWLMLMVDDGHATSDHRHELADYWGCYVTKQRAELSTPTKNTSFGPTTTTVHV